MVTKIAVIGPPDLVELVQLYQQKHLMLFSDLKLIAYPYQHESNTIELIGTLQNVDAILFTGPVPFHMCQGIIPPSLMVDYIAISPLSILQLLCGPRAVINEPLEGVRFSADFVSQTGLETVLEDWGIEDCSIYTYAYTSESTTQQLVDFHAVLQEKGLTDFAVTCLASANDALQAAGLSAYRCKITKSAIRDALLRMRSVAAKATSNDFQICRGILKLTSNAKDGDVPYQSKRHLLTIMDNFISFCEIIHASFRIENDTEMSLTTTRGMMEQATETNQQMPLLADISGINGFSVSIGIGYGVMANAAERNARRGLALAQQNGGEGCYCVAEDGQTTIMVAGRPTLGYKSASNNPTWIALAKQCGVGVATLNRIVSIASIKANEQFTALDVAEGLRITPRSARRVLKDLLDGGAVKVVGEQQGPTRGRPRQVFMIATLLSTNSEENLYDITV